MRSSGLGFIQEAVVGSPAWQVLTAKTEAQGKSGLAEPSIQLIWTVWKKGVFCLSVWFDRVVRSLCRLHMSVFVNKVGALQGVVWTFPNCCLIHLSPFL